MKKIKKIKKEHEEHEEQVKTNNQNRTRSVNTSQHQLTHQYNIGDRIECRFKPGHFEFYPGQIWGINEEKNSYVVKYDDGTIDEDVVDVETVTNKMYKVKDSNETIQGCTFERIKKRETPAHPMKKQTQPDTVAEYDWQTMNHPLLNARVTRSFVDNEKVVRFTQGTITKWLPPDNVTEDEALFHMVHDDGDEEDLDETELMNGKLNQANGAHHVSYIFISSLFSTSCISSSSFNISFKNNLFF